MTHEEAWYREVNRKLVAHDRLLADFQRGLDALTEQVDATRQDIDDAELRMRSTIAEAVATPFDQER